MTDMFFDLFQIVLLVACFIFVLWINRVNAVFDVRTEFIDDDELWGSGYYKKLPSPNQMIYTPMHWHRWTKRQWVKYVESLEVGE